MECHIRREWFGCRAERGVLYRRDRVTGSAVDCVHSCHRLNTAAPFATDDNLRLPVSIEIVATPEIAVREFIPASVPARERVEHDRSPATILLLIEESKHDLLPSVSVHVRNRSDLRPQLAEVV